MREIGGNEEEFTSMEYKSEGSALVNVSHLDIPAELAMIIQSLNGRYTIILYFSSDFVQGGGMLTGKMV